MSPLPKAIERAEARDARASTWQHLSAKSEVRGHPGKDVLAEWQKGPSIVLRPISITYVGLCEMLSNGTLYACDAAQCRHH